MTDRTDFERTARYWTEVYAMDKPSTSSSSIPEKATDEAKLNGLDERHVNPFVNMGFPRSKVIEVLAR